MKTLLVTVLFLLSLNANAVTLMFGDDAGDQFRPGLWGQHDNAGKVIRGLTNNGGTNRFGVNLMPLAAATDDEVSASHANRNVFVLTNTIANAYFDPVYFMYVTNSLQDKDVFTLTASGYANSETGVAFQLHVGTAMFTFTVTNQLVAEYWRLESTVTVRSYGTNGQVFCEGIFSTDSVTYVASGASQLNTTQPVVTWFGGYLVDLITIDDYMDCRSLHLKRE